MRTYSISVRKFNSNQCWYLVKKFVQVKTDSTQVGTRSIQFLSSAIILSFSTNTKTLTVSQWESIWINSLSSDCFSFTLISAQIRPLILSSGVIRCWECQRFDSRAAENRTISPHLILFGFQDKFWLLSVVKPADIDSTWWKPQFYCTQETEHFIRPPLVFLRNPLSFTRHGILMAFLRLKVCKANLQTVPYMLKCSALLQYLWGVRRTIGRVQINKLENHQQPLTPEISATVYLKGIIGNCKFSYQPTILYYSVVCVFVPNRLVQDIQFGMQLPLEIILYLFESLNCYSKYYGQWATVECLHFQKKWLK